MAKVGRHKSLHFGHHIVKIYKRVAKKGKMDDRGIEHLTFRIFMTFVNAKRTLYH